MTEQKKILHVNSDQKKVGVAILNSDRKDFKTKKVCPSRSYGNYKHIHLIMEYESP